MSTKMFIKFEDPAIIGDGSEPGHESELPIVSWSHGFGQPAGATRSTAGSATVGQATHQSLSFTKYLDKATNDLLKICWSGKQIGKATITCYRSIGGWDDKLVRYLEIVMQHVVISNYSVSGGPGDVPVENVSLDYGIVQYNYVDQKHVGGIQPVASTAAHNLKTGAIS